MEQMKALEEEQRRAREAIRKHSTPESTSISSEILKRRQQMQSRINQRSQHKHEKRSTDQDRSSHSDEVSLLSDQSTEVPSSPKKSYKKMENPAPNPIETIKKLDKIKGAPIKQSLPFGLTMEEINELRALKSRMVKPAKSEEDLNDHSRNLQASQKLSSKSLANLTSVTSMA